MTDKYDIALVVGTRPNFVKAAPLLNKIEEQNKKVLFIHTGQHFDKNMSKNIFDDLSMRTPDINLNAPSDSQSKQFQYIVQELQKIFNNCEIGKVGVFGDVTSTLAASIAAKQSDLYLFHVESGLRSNNLGMPEERNRIMVDAISDLLLIPSEDARENLLKEKISPDKIHNVGNIMIDTLAKNKSKIINNSVNIRNNLNINKSYFVVTLHRPSNLNDDILEDVFGAISNFTDYYQVILPAHPRLKNYIENNNIELSNVILIDPLSYIDFMSLVYGCDLVLTDSGGIQEETTYLGINCLTLREETERPITVQEGTNKVIGTNKENIINEINNVLGSKISNEAKIKYWDGETSDRILQLSVDKPRSKSTTASHEPESVKATISVGQIAVGSSASTTTISILHETELSPSSVAVTVTAVIPTPNSEPEGIDSTTVVVQLSVTVYSVL